MHFIFINITATFITGQNLDCKLLKTILSSHKSIVLADVNYKI